MRYNLSIFHRCPTVFHFSYTLIIWSVAVVSVCAILPFIALSTYGFLLDGDIHIYVTVLEQGVWGYFTSFYNGVMGRYSIMILHGPLTYFLQVLGMNPWEWNRITAIFFILIQVGSLAWLFRVILPTLRWPFIISLATIPLAAIFAKVNDGWLIWPGSTYAYGTSFALYVSFVAYFAGVYGKRVNNFKSTATLCIIFFFYVGTHELAIIPMGIFLILAFLLSLNFNGTDKPISKIFPLSEIRIGASLRPNFDNRFFIVTIIALSVLLCLGALILVGAPAWSHRETVWPAQMSLLDAIINAVSMSGVLFSHFFDAKQPYFILLFLFVLFVGRTSPLRSNLVGTNRYFLLIPFAVFICIIYIGNILVAISRGGGIIPRVEGYLLSYAYVAIACLALFLVQTQLMQRIQKKTASILGIMVFIVLIVTFSGDASYRSAVNTAKGSGYEHSLRIAKLVKLLEDAKGGVAHVAELERPPLYVQGVIHGPNTEANFQSQVARGFGVKKVIFMPCGASIDPLWCHYRFNPQDGHQPEFMPPEQYSGPGIKKQAERIRLQKLQEKK